jgi:hypothetical protein
MSKSLKIKLIILKALSMTTLPKIEKILKKLCDKIDVNEKEIDGLEKWKWTVGGVLIAMTFLMTASQTFGLFN